MSCGNFFSAFLTDHGAVWSMGNNESNQLGHSRGAFEVKTPCRVEHLVEHHIRIHAISAGHHFCACLDEHDRTKLWVVGNYFVHDMLDDSVAKESNEVYCVPFFLSSRNPGEMKISTVASGYQHICVLTVQGSVYVLGRGEEGQKGDDGDGDGDGDGGQQNGRNSTGKSKSSPHCVFNGANRWPPKIVDIVSGFNHLCAINVKNEYYFWGSDEYREITGLCTCGCEYLRNRARILNPHRVIFRNLVANEDILDLFMGFHRTVVVVGE